jgi:Protein of unknown function (DUF433)
MPVYAVFQNLESGATIDEIAEWFDISKDEIIEVLKFAARSVAAPESVEMMPALDAHPVWSQYAGSIVFFLIGHTITKARDRGWDRLTNGDLLAAAETAGFDVLLTADNSIRYQQNLSRRRIALVVLSCPQWPRVRLQIERIAAALNSATPGSYCEVDIPYL